MKARSYLLLVFIILCSASLDAQISGTVFYDFNQNGIKDAGEDNLEGVTVTAFSSAGISVTTSTLSNGTYSFANSGITASGNQIRLEFSGLPSYLQTGYSGGTSVRFVTAGATTTNINYWGINSQDYCQDNPQIVTTCFTASPSILNDVVVKWSYDNVGTAPLDKTAITLEPSAGSVWGIAYARTEMLIYTSSFLMRHMSLGPAGLDAIYTIDPFSVTPNATPWLELTDDLNIPVSSINAQPQYLTNAARGTGTPPQNDPQAFGDVGKVGLGDIELSADEKTLYVVNLYDKTLYAIDIATKTLVGSYLIPNPGCSNGQYRPWGIGEYNGQIFVGSICDGSNSGNPNSLTDNSGLSNLTAHIYRLDGASFSNVLSFPLNYLREPNSRYAGGDCEVPTYWKPWTDVVPVSCPNGLKAYSTPILSDIEFDDRGNMIMGFLDRTGLQISNDNYGPTGTSLLNISLGGDILKACKTASGWSIEGTSCTNSLGEAIGIPTTNGYFTDFGQWRSKPGEFYSGDYFHQNGGIDRTGLSFDPGHGEISFGGLVVVPNTGEVMLTSYDPVTGASIFATGGVITLNNTSGQRPRNGYQIYDNIAGGQGKGLGLGDLEALCDPAPIEIGNRVWVDTDGDGIQDAGEAPITGVPVQLIKDGNVIATATTDVNGNYYFSSARGTSTASAIYGIIQLEPNMTYIVRIPNVQGGSKQAALGINNLTTANADGSTNGDLRDSDGSLVGNNAEVTVQTTDIAVAGANNHTFDFGFSPPLCNINAIVPQNLECLDNGTPALITDNRIRFSANVTNSNALLTGYNVTINGGTTITPNMNVPYGVTQFTLGAGTAGGGATYTVTVTDSATPGCTQTFQVIDPGTCTPATPECPPVQCGTATIQVNGN